MVPGATYVVPLQYWFPILNLWFLWNIMEVLPCWQKDLRNFVSPQVKSLHSQCNAMRHLTYYKQSYCKDIQIYTILNTHEE